MTIATVLLISYFMERLHVSKPESLIPCMLNKNNKYGFYSQARRMRTQHYYGKTESFEMQIYIEKFR